MGGDTSVTASDSSANSQYQPLTASQRSDIYNGALSDISSSFPTMVKANGDGSYNLNSPTYQAPTYANAGYQGAGAAQQIDGGDINKMQAGMTSGYTAGLDYAKQQDVSKENSTLAGRGIWSSGLADKAIQDVNSSYAGQYATAGANATNAAYNLANSQNQGVNTYNTQNAATANTLAQQNANAQNTFNLNNATNTQSSAWAPLTYLEGLWNGTGGQTGSSSSNSSSLGVSAGFSV